MSDQNRRPQANRPPQPLSEAAVLDMLPAYVLGSLEVDEMLAMADFIADHPSLLDRVAALEATADQLALAAPQAAPRPAAKARLMARAQADVGVHSMLSAMDTKHVHAEPAPPPSVPADPAPVRPPLTPAVPRTMGRATEEQAGWIDRARRLLGGSLFWPSLAAGTLAALLIVAVYAAQVGRAANSIAAQLTTAQQQITQLQSEMDQLVQVNRQLEELIDNNRAQLALFSAADRVVILVGTSDAPTASGLFYTGPEDGLLVLRGLPRLPAEQTYELWLIPGEGAPISAGLVQVGEGDSQTFPIALSGQSTEFAAVGLSIEPAGGSPSPTGPIVLLGRVG